MKRFLLLISLFVGLNFAQGSTVTPYDTLGWDLPATYTNFYKLYIHRLLSNPGGRININTAKIDSLLNELIVFTDTSQIVIRNDTLRFADNFVQTILADTYVLTEFDTAEVVAFKPLSTPPTHQEGAVWYDNTNHALVVYNDKSDTRQQLGQETYLRVYNAAGSTITNGQAVFIKSAYTDVPTVRKAISSADSTSSVIGLATHDIPAGQYGYVTMFGIVNNVNTSGMALGDRVYLSSTVSGGLTNSKQYPPNHNMEVGVVTKVNSTTGAVFVNHPHYINGESGGTMYVNDGSTVIALDQNVEKEITNGTNNLLTPDTDVVHGVIMTSDQIGIITDGIYEIKMTMSFGGGTAGLYKFYMKKNGTLINKYKVERATSSADVGAVTMLGELKLVAGDIITFWVINTGSGTDLEVKQCTINVEQQR